MSSAEFAHVPVMLAEVVAAFAPVPAGVVVDATLGGGGHSAAILAAYPHLRIVGLDQDPSAIAAASARLAGFGARATVVRARFDRLATVLDELGIDRLSGSLFDLGVSSPQLDRAERGFSYRSQAPLDMRMDPDAPRTAADIVNGMAAGSMAKLFAEHGEGRFGRRIAAAIVAARPIRTTAELAEVVRGAIPAPARRTGGHPAKRVFQAVRVAVNQELDILPQALDDALARLDAGGRAVVLAYHSGEDRIVKERFRHAITGGCVCPPGLPCVCGAAPIAKAVTRKALGPGSDEVSTNPRAESARMRVVEGLGAESGRADHRRSPDGTAHHRGPSEGSGR